MYGEIKTLREIKVGYVRLKSEFSGDAFESPAGNEIENGIIKLMENNKIKIIRSEKDVNYYDNAIEVAKQMLAEDVDAIVVFVVGWIESTTGHTLVKELKGIPVLFWTYTMHKVNNTIDTTGSFVGFAVLKGALERMGYNISFIVGDYKKENNRKDLLSFLNVARAIKEMDRARIGLIGYFSIGMYSATIDNLLMKQKIGPEIVAISELEFDDMIDNTKENEIQLLRKYLEENTTIDSEVDEPLMEKMLSMYVAFDKLIEKYKLDAVNPRCHFEVSRKCMACIPLALLADRKIVTGCESDILLSISMLLHFYLSHEAVTYFDIMDFDEDTIYFSNCGFSPLCFVESKPKLGYVDPKEWGFRGITNANLMKKGSVDMLRLYEKVNNYGLLYTKAKSIDAKVRGNIFPSMKVELENGTKELIKYLPSQHLSIAYSKIEREIELFCKYKNIELHSV